MKFSRSNLALGLAVLFLAGVWTVAIPAFKKSPSFTNAIAESGISTQGGSGGASWTDINSDGYFDLFFQSALGVKLYLGDGKGKFKEVSHQAGLSEAGGLVGIFGDFDNDGCKDLFISRSSDSHFERSEGKSDLLYRNNCDGTFSDVTSKSGIKDSYHGQGASWVDFNRDGFLDIYVVNYGLWFNDNDFIFEPNILYQGNGDGTFTDVTVKAGAIGKADCRQVDRPQNPAKIYTSLGGWKESFQPIWFDFNNDLWPDLFVATDYGVSPLFKNNGDGTFTDVTEEAGMCRFGTGMGVSAGDYNNDSYLDLYITNVGVNYLWKNNRDETFTEVGINTKTSNQEGVYVGWGTEFLDYDNDGNLDLYTINGMVRVPPELRDQVEARHDKLFKGDGQGNFQDVASKEGIVGNDAKLSLALADYNLDGFTDIFISSDTSRATDDPTTNRLYRNTPNGNNYLTVELIGTRSNRDAVGARIILKSGGKNQIREVISGSSFVSQSSLWQTFGLGRNSKIEEIEIRWPSGAIQNLFDVNINQKITATEEF